MIDSTIATTIKDAKPLITSDGAAYKKAKAARRERNAPRGVRGEGDLT